jgi:transcription termination/antitermination protein NusG
MSLDRFDKCWFALQVRPRYEFIAANTLRGKGFEQFLPTYTMNRKWSDRTKQINLPLFPGYVFCRFNAEIRVPILTTPGVIRILGTDSGIPVGEIEAIRAVVTSRLPATPCSYLKIGTKVQVIDGPLAGVQGILTSYGNQQTFILSITLVQGSISVEIEPGNVALVQESATQIVSRRQQPFDGAINSAAAN